MTSYSVLSASHDRASIIATWPGFDYEEHSTRVTTLATASAAHSLATELTRLSEAAWDAAMWLDTSPHIERAISELATQLRTADLIGPLTVPTDGLRHVKTWTTSCFVNQVSGEDFIATLTDLTHAQRLSVAAELEADSSERRDMLDPDLDEFDSSSRVNQAGLVTRVYQFGASGEVPEGSAGYLRFHYGDYLDFGERWDARQQLRRMEQLVAACKHHYASQSDIVDEVCLARCIVTPADDANTNDIRFSIRPVAYGLHSHTPHRPNPSGPLRISRPGNPDVEVDPSDTAGFVTAMGEWAATFAE